MHWAQSLQKKKNTNNECYLVKEIAEKIGLFDKFSLFETLIEIKIEMNIIKIRKCVQSNA